MEFKISSSVSQIPALSLFNDGFELSDQTIIPSEDIAGSFSPEENKVELFIYDVNTSLLDSVYDYNGWTITQNSDTSESGNTDTLQIDPSNDLIKRGYDVGDLYAVYNFINYELATSPTDLLYISEISSDRTEIKLNSNFTSNEDLGLTFEILQSKVDNADFFDEFYIASEGNNYNIGINLLLDTSTDQYSILIKLYDALPDSFSLKDEVYVATKVAETQAYEVKFFNDSSLDIDDTPYLRGPNYNLEIKDFVNNSTELKSKSELLDAVTTGSNNNLQNILNQKGVKITPNYSFSTFNEFVNFSSAKERIRNFYEKVSQIQSYEDDITTINSSITGSTSGSAQVSSSLSSANSNIENIIKNFDGYEYHLFYTSGSSAYPKISGSDFPHPLQNTGSTEVLQWLGSDVEGSATYGGIILSASLYDNNNQNWLYYTIPEFIRDNPDNNNYIDFSNMVGQHFDEIWLYTKAVTEKNNTTNELDKGIPLKLSQDAIKSLGYEGFGNNFNNQNNYIGLIGEEDGSFVPPTGNEVIDNYIAINNGTVVNYWSPSYSFLYYVEQLGEKGFPYPIDKVSKEIYKRLYHNMAYLVKKKGTVSGLRQLINIWGIPDTILRINEFGGKNKDNTDDYDYWYNRYSYAFSPISTQNYASASAVIPWMPLERNRVTNNEYIVPDNLQFRFKTSGYPSSSYAGEFFSQSLAVKKSDGDETSTNFDFGVGLFYTGSAVGSYSGSNDDTYKNWGVMRFYISGSSSEGGTVVSDDIYLPFYDNGWWSVMLQRDTHPSASVHTTDTNYTLYVKNKTYNGKDRNQIAFQGSASISINGSTSSSINEAWNKFGTGSHDGVYLGGLVSGSNVGPNTLNPSGKMFSGSFQEFRYYSNDIPETVFNDFVMNPESIEGNNITGLESSFDIVNFRAPLGNELEDKFETSISSSHTESFTSFHPAVSAKSTLLITGSFVNPDGNVTSSNYHIRYYENSTTRTFSQPNTEVYFLDQPSIGVRNRISNKIEIDDGDDFGTVLSNQISIEQDYEISRSYTEDITSLEVAFSPQDNVNDDIIQAFGYGIVSDALADPRFISSSDDYYPKLREAAEYFFQKYTEGNIYDYIRLIKYVDNSLFKAIKAYVPARTSVSTGIIIKQHMLERNRFTPPSITNKTTIAVYPKNPFNTPLIFKNLELTSSIDVGEIKGEAGGVVNKFNYTGSPSFGETSITQSYNNTFDTPFGLQTIVEDTQKEFYDGEYSGSNLTTTTQSLFNNPFSIFPPEFSFSYSEQEIFEWDSQYTSVVGAIYNPTLEKFVIARGGGSGASPTRLYTIDPKNNSVVQKAGWISDITGMVYSSKYDKYYLFTNYSPITPGFSGVKAYTILSDLITLESIYEKTWIDSTDAPWGVSSPQNWKFREIESSGYIYGVGSNYYDKTDNVFMVYDPNTDTLINTTPITTISNNFMDVVHDPTTDKFFMVADSDANPSTMSPNLPGLGKGELFVVDNGTFAVRKIAEYTPFRLADYINPRCFILGGNLNVVLRDNSNKLTLNKYDLSTELLISSTLLPTQTTTLSPNISLSTFQNFFFITTDNSGIFYINNNDNRNPIDSEGDSILGYDLDGELKFEYSLNDRISPFSPQDIAEPNATPASGYFSPINNTFISLGARYPNLSTVWMVNLDYNTNSKTPSSFANSIYNALINNFNQNRPNSFLQSVDNSTNSGSSLLPINIDQINSNSAIKVNTPDSNYTMRRITRPRYEGSRLQSADYNFFTPGDISFGTTAVVDSHPIYMAHFKSSKENYELWDSYTFNIDALIELPFEDITGKEETTSIPSIIKIDGSNDNLFEISKVFDQGRKALISYDSSTSESIDLTSLSVGSNQIYQGGLEYNLINGSELGKIEYDDSQTYITASWYECRASGLSLTNTFALLPSQTNYNKYMSTGSNSITAPFNLGLYTNGDETGYLNNSNMGEILLKGAYLQISSSAGSIAGSPPTSTIEIVGESLALLNSLNTAVKKGKYFELLSDSPISSPTTYQGDVTFGYTPKLNFNDPDFDVNDINNYTRFNSSSSLNRYYTDPNLPFTIEKGDELRITYNSLDSSALTPNYVTQDFTVLAVGNTTGTYGGGFSPQPNTPLISSTLELENPNNVSPAPTLPPIITSVLSNRDGTMGSISGIYDSLIVTPNPKTLPNLIPSGSILNFTIRRRVEADDRVIVFQSPPLNSEGAKTPTGPGFLLPNDLTPQQKRNALTLISQLKGTNTFKE